jgi:2-C-methyl-D-erythritol 4-phosphate cytidylyltransferase
MTVVVGIVPAGGSGERLGAERPKAFVVVGGKALLDYSVRALGAVCGRVVVAAPRGQRGEGRGQSGASFVEGGPSRSASVRNAVLSAPDADVFVVHDAARPFVTVDLVERCVAALVDVDAVVAAAPVTDTVKEARDGLVVRTLDRSGLWAIQTPQVFRREVLERALAQPGDVLAQATDDASLVESLGGTVRLVESPRENFKVTTPEDLRLADLLLRAR